jgi:hypothetical protein
VSNRLDRGRKVASFLRGRTGFPFIKYRYPDSMLEMPDGYHVLMSIAKRSLEIHIPAVRARRHEPGISAVVWAYGAKDVEEAVVFMPLGSFTALLKTHIEQQQKAAAGEGE